MPKFRSHTRQKRQKTYFEQKKELLGRLADPTLPEDKRRSVQKKLKKLKKAFFSGHLSTKPRSPKTEFEKRQEGERLAKIDATHGLSEYKSMRASFFQGGAPGTGKRS